MADSMGPPTVIRTPKGVVGGSIGIGSTVASSETAVVIKNF
jgi:hypothetical protein